MQFYKEEAQAIRDLKKAYFKLKELEMHKDPEALASLYIEMGEQYGRSKRWCENKLEMYKEAKAVQ